MIICCLTYIHMVNKKINNIPSLSHNTNPDAACPPVIDTPAALCACKQRNNATRWASGWHLCPQGCGVGVVGVVAGGRAAASRDLPLSGKPEHLPRVTYCTLSKVGAAAARIFHTFPWENKATRNKLPETHCKHTHPHVSEQALLTYCPHTHTTFRACPLVRWSPHRYIDIIEFLICFHPEINGGKGCARLFMRSKDSSIKPERRKERAWKKKFLKTSQYTAWNVRKA